MEFHYDSLYTRKPNSTFPSLQRDSASAKAKKELSLNFSLEDCIRDVSIANKSTGYRITDTLIIGSSVPEMIQTK